MTDYHDFGLGDTAMKEKIVDTEEVAAALYYAGKPHPSWCEKVLAAEVKRLHRVRAEEREKCAKLAEAYAPLFTGSTDTRQIHGAGMANTIAKAIRARSDVKKP